MQEYQQLKTMVLQVEEDLAKAAGGNRAAGTRVRKAMQEIKSLAQEIRKRVLEVRSSEDQQR